MRSVGSVKVPLNYAKPGGKKITLALSRSTHADNRKDARDAFAAEASLKHGGWTIFGRGEITENRELLDLEDLDLARDERDERTQALGDVGGLEQLLGPLPQHGAREAEVPAVDDQVVPDRELLVQVVLLRYHAQVRPYLRAPALRVQAHDGQGPGRALGDAADHPHDRGLARPVGTEQPGDARRQSHRDVVDRDHVAEPAGDLLQVDSAHESAFR